MMKQLTCKFLSILFLGLLLAGCKTDYNDDVVKPPTPQPGQAVIDWEKAADSSTTNMIAQFWNPSGSYFNDKNTSTGFNYWPQAHALDVLVDAYERTGKGEYKMLMDMWYNGVKQKNGNTFLNEFYDDMEWNALAMLRVYNATGDEKYKTAVDGMWQDIKTGWNTTMGGGIAWRKSQLYYKNTPANAPACILAARLYRKFGNASDLEWSKKIYDWLKVTLFDQGSGWVYDGINSNNDGVKNTSWKFTYNQGGFIGAALELYKITNDISYLNDAIAAANFTLSDNSLNNMSDNLLKDEGGGDGGLFKGVFVRYFTQLILADGMLSSDKKRYADYLKHNAQTLWNVGTDKSYLLYGSYWKNKPGAQVELTVQLSGAMLMEASALLKKNGVY